MEKRERRRKELKTYLHYALSTTNFSDFDNDVHFSLLDDLYSCSILPSVL